MLVHRFLKGKTRNLFGSPVEEGIDPSIHIHRQDAIGHVFQDVAAGQILASA